MTTNIGSLAVSLSMDSSSFNGSLSQVDRNLRAMGSELKAVKALGTEYGKSLEGLKSKKDVLSRSLEASNIKLTETRKKYDELKASGTASEVQLERQAKKVNDAQAAYNRLQTELEEVDKALKTQSSSWYQMSQRLESTGTKLKSVGDGMKDVGKDLSMKVTAPLVAMGTGAFKAAVDFESAMAGVKKTVEISDEGFRQLEKGIRDMSKELPTAATDIASVAESAGQLGIANDNILGFTRTIIDLSEATNLTREQAASEFARFANIVGMSQKDFDRFGSSIVSLGNNMATTESEILSMGMRLAAQGAQVGMTEAQIAALSATMSSLGIEAEAGGTAMTTVLKKIDSAVGEGGKSLEGFAKAAGVSSSDFATAWNSDPIAALDMFIKGLSASSEQGANLTTILDALGISGIRESDTILRMAGASDLLSEAVSNSTLAWQENTALTNEAAQRYETTASQIKILWNEVKDLGIEIGGILIPTIRDGIDTVRPWIQSFSEASDETKKLIVGIGGTVAAIGPMLVIGGTLVSSLGSVYTGVSTVTGAIAVLRSGSIAATPAIGTMAGALNLLIGPVGLIALAVGGLSLAYMHMGNKAKEAARAQEELYASIDKNINNSSTLANEYDVLSAKLQTMNKNSEEAKIAKARLSEIMDELNRLSPNIVQGYDNQSGSIRTMRGEVNSLTEALRINTEEQLKNARVSQEKARARLQQVQQQRVDLLRNYDDYSSKEIRKMNKKIMEDEKALRSSDEYLGKMIKSLEKALVDSAPLNNAAAEVEEIATTFESVGKSAGSSAKQIKNATDTIKEAFQSSMELINDKKYFGELSLNNELAILNNLLDKYKDHAEQRKQLEREIYRVKKEIEKEGLENSKKYIDEQKYYGQMSLIDELKAWERVQSRYKEGTEERKQLDREVYRVKKEIHDQLTALNNDYAQKMKDINDKLREDELAAEKDYVDKVKQIKDKLVDDEIKAKEDYESKVKSINEKLIADEKRVTEEYQKAVEDRTRSLYSFAGIFDEVNKKNISGGQLLKNLEGQIDTFKDWQSNIDSLSSRGLNEDLVKELQDMGPKAANEIAALTTLSDGELQKYAQLWQEKHSLAKSESVAQLEGLRAETEFQISELRINTEIQLEELRVEYNSIVSELRKEAEKQMEDHKKEWLAKVEDMRKKSNETMEKFKIEWLQKVREITSGTKTEFDLMAASMPQVGVDTMTGLMQGLESMRGELMARARSIADAIRSEIESALDIHSPSRVMMQIGRYVGEGLALGMEGSIDSVARQANALAKASVPEVEQGYSSVQKTTRTGSSGAGITQHITIKSPKALSPSETARKNLQASRQLAMEWGLS